MDRALKILRQIGMVIALIAIAFFGTIGAATIFSQRSLDTFTPTSSSDLASWVQAVGAIIAIVFSYRLGARQLNQVTEANRQAEEAQLKELAGRKYEVRHAYQDAVRISMFLTTTDGKAVADFWHSNFASEFDAAVIRLDAIATTGFTTNQIRCLRRLANETRKIRTAINAYYGPDYSAIDGPDYRERVDRFQADLQRRIPRLHESYRIFFAE
ncbi:hypothetical protein [Achromobacter xylosoxidans]|uniref:hypothetical protein n=1 Tax=Alcaligenes xylosoxydans xylosoxydans TaxID=85698 RepID=UPI003D08294E